MALIALLTRTVDTIITNLIRSDTRIWRCRRGLVAESAVSVFAFLAETAEFLW